MKNIFIICLVIIFSFKINALIIGTSHPDGSITNKEGEVLRKSYADRYQEALDAFNNGEEITDWPTVKKTKKGKTFGKKGFFGEKILEEGAPLLAIDKVTGSKDEILNNIAKQNGYINEDILKISLVANSSELFQSENNISVETFESLHNSYKKLIEAGIIGENLSKFNELTNVILAADDEVISGEVVNDDDIQIDGIDPVASLAEIAKSLDLDESLVTSRAMAETLSAIANQVSNEVSSRDPNMGPAIDPNTGNATLAY
tara:strand:+ start:107 stop:886 length:780 start_codon:yes stop_codon:yes gene_type:complete